MTTAETDWSCDRSRHLYRVNAWSDGYFDIDTQGNAVARPLADGPDIKLIDLARKLRDQGLRLPALVRFTDILSDRVSQLCAAFDDAATQHDYRGRYTAVYPIKVNQQRTVVEHILRGNQTRVGLEAGSKPELLAVLGLAPAGQLIVCNGYKDHAFMRLALAGVQLGHAVYLVVEKPSELDDILSLADETGALPHLGLRVRLASVASGHWQNTGGERSKFGLTAAQVVAAVQRLRTAGHLDAVRMLHVHVGSQVADRAALRTAMAEAAQYFRALRELGAPIDCVDVGGGLAVDYEGRRATSFCSMNYNFADYADMVTGALARVCQEHRLPQPDIFSESGRALTAHHAVLLTEIIDSEPMGVPNGPAGHKPTDSLAACHDATRGIESAQQAFISGSSDLAARAEAECQGYARLRAAAAGLNLDNPEHRDMLNELEDKLADKYYANFSIFQSIPDVWALDQIFPVLPLQWLQQHPDRRVRLCDLTCDSDGRMDRYVDAEGVDGALPLHALRPDEPYLLGIFLVGAYQENLGDMHNLFGDTDAVNVEVSEDGWHLYEPEHGDTAAELLRLVHFQPERLRAAYQRKAEAASLSAHATQECLTLLAAGLDGYTYLLD